MAAYYFYRRMLSYYIDLSGQAETAAAAKRIATMMKAEKQEILRVYQKDCEGRGDRVRMRTFLIMPAGYMILNKVYEKVIIPLRNK